MIIIMNSSATCATGTDLQDAIKNYEDEIEVIEDMYGLTFYEAKAFDVDRAVVYKKVE